MTDPQAMPLEDYIQETVNILQQTPTPKDVLLKRVQALRFAERNAWFADIFEAMNTRQKVPVVE